MPALPPDDADQPVMGGLKRSGFKPRQSTMKPGAGLRATKPMARTGKPMRAKSKTNAKRDKTGEDKLCRGQPCYLAIPGCCTNDIATVVPCHSNQLIHGKGKGIKAFDKYTVPGCRACHYNLDQGRDLTKEQRHEIWDSAYRRWSKFRMEKYGV